MFNKLKFVIVQYLYCHGGSEVKKIKSNTFYLLKQNTGGGGGRNQRKERFLFPHSDYPFGKYGVEVKGQKKHLPFTLGLLVFPLLTRAYGASGVGHCYSSV